MKNVAGPIGSVLGFATFFAATIAHAKMTRKIATTPAIPEPRKVVYVKSVRI